MQPLKEQVFHDRSEQSNPAEKELWQGKTLA